MKASDIPDRDALEACERAHAPEQTADARRASYCYLTDSGYPPKVVDAKFARLARRGLIEAGVSIRTAWLTDRGRALLVSLRGAGTTQPSDRIER